jgi:hypothetical protein
MEVYNYFEFYSIILFIAKIAFSIYSSFYYAFKFIMLELGEFFLGVLGIIYYILSTILLKNLFKWFRISRLIELSIKF